MHSSTSAKRLVTASASLVAVALLATSTHATAVAAVRSEAQQKAAVVVDDVPLVRIKMNKQGVPRTRTTFDFSPGLIRFSIAGKSNCPVWFLRLHDGYKYADFKRDQYAMFTGDLAARDRLWANSDYMGGTPGRVGQKVTGTLTLAAAGRYVIASFGQLLSKPIRFDLTGDRQKRVAPEFDSTIFASEGGEWRGATSLPTSGTLRFKNKDATPHQLYLQPVDDGTTKRQVLRWFRAHGPEDGPPAWLAPGPRLGLEPLDPGASETRTYVDYAPGTYLAWEQVGWDRPPPTMLAIIRIVD